MSERIERLHMDHSKVHINCCSHRLSSSFTAGKEALEGKTSRLGSTSQVRAATLQPGSKPFRDAVTGCNPNRLKRIDQIIIANSR
jgi:hypothetical protein